MGKSQYVLALDPSGNFHEGTGTTGWVLFFSPNPKVVKPIKWGSIDAGLATRQEEHWHSHINLIKGLTESIGEKPVIVVEDYLLYANTSEAQINSRFETPQMIGVIKHYAYMNGYECFLQTAASVKQRWSDEILEHKGYILTQQDPSERRRYTKVMLRTNKGDVTISRHTLDALRHGVHYCVFKLHKRP